MRPIQESDDMLSNKITMIFFVIFSVFSRNITANTFETHCVSCHGAKSSLIIPDFVGDPTSWKKLLESEKVNEKSEARVWIEPMYRQLVDRKSMPPAHMTSSFRNSDEERELVQFLIDVRPVKAINQKPVGQILSTETLNRYRLMIPEVQSKEISEILQSPATFFYDEYAMPQAYVDDEDKIQGYLQTSDGIAQQRTSVISNGRFRFPFGHTAGMHKAAGTHFNFLYLPNDGQRTLTVAITENGRRWIFPEGTYIGEVLYQRNQNGDLPFEVRVSWKENGRWKYDAFRPFATASQLLSRIEQLRLEPGFKEDQYLTGLESHLKDPATLVPDTLFEAGANFNGIHPTLKAGKDTLPPLTESRVRTLLRTPFVSALGSVWRRDDQRNLSSFAPTGSTSAHLAAHGYAGHFFSVETVTCNRCHVEARRSLDTFFPGDERAFQELASYGKLWGSDQKFSFFPLYSNTGEVPRRIAVNQSLIQAGIVEMHNTSRHPAHLYQSTDRR